MQFSFPGPVGGCFVHVQLLYPLLMSLYFCLAMPLSEVLMSFSDNKIHSNKVYRDFCYPSKALLPALVTPVSFFFGLKFEFLHYSCVPSELGLALTSH